MADNDEDAAALKNYLTLKTKIDIVIEMERRVYAEKSISLRAFTREKSDATKALLQPGQLRRWKNNLCSMKASLELTSKKQTKQIASAGRPSRLERITHKIIPYVTNIRAIGGKVSTKMVALRAKKFDPDLRRMKRYTLFAIVRRYLVAKGIVSRAFTHQSQEDPRKMAQEATAYLDSMRPQVAQANRHQKYIINMDQTPYNPQDSEKTTLDFRGNKTVSGKVMKTSVGRVTCFLTVCADGTKVRPLLVYKAKPGGSVEREFSNEDDSLPYCCVQENAWTDERVMLLWVEKVLAPYVATAPEGVVPLLLLDKYKCHYQGSVTKAIEDLGCEWDIIPGGCTFLIQPVDVGCGKPFKNRMRNKMEEWLADQYNNKTGTVLTNRIVPKEVRAFIRHWAAKSWGVIPEEFIYNSWRHAPFLYFPNESTVHTGFSQDDEIDNENEYHRNDELELPGEEDTGSV